MEAPHNLEAATPKPEKHLAEFKSQVFAVAISPQGREHVAVGLEDGTIEIWNLLSGTKLLSCQGHKGSIWSLAFNHDGTQIVSGSSDMTVRLWNVTTGQAIDRPLWVHRDFVKTVAFNHNSTQVVSGSDDRRVRLWDVTTGQAIDRPSWVHKDFVKSVAFNHDGSMLVSGGRDNMVRLWDVTTGQAIDRPSWVHKNFIRSVAFSPDGSMIVSGSWDKTVRLWSVATGQAIGDPFYHTDDVRSVAFSPDGRMIISGGSDNMVRLWDISDPQHKRQIIIGEHESPIYSVAFDPQEDYIISASTDGIKVWRWQELNIYRVSQAFSNDQANGEDSLDVTKELQSLADVLMLRSLEPPLAVAILGSWGSGKSFGMHLIEKQITKIRCQQLTGKQTWGDKGDEPNLSPYVGHVYQIKFNAWSYAKSDLWASLMQTIFEQLDRQLTLEKQLADKPEKLLEGGDIWRVLNQMSDSDRKAILKLELGQDVFTNLKDDNALWTILSEVRKEEQEKLKESEDKLQKLETQAQKEKEKIEKETNQEFENKSRIIVFLTQLKELSKDDFGNSILKDFLNTYDFKDKNDLESQFEIFKDLDKMQESDLIEKIEDLIKTKDGKIENIIKKSNRIKNFVEEQPSQIVGLIEFIRKDKRTLVIFIVAMSLPFISYCVMVYVLPNILPDILPAIGQITSALKLWLTTVSAIPAIGFGIEILKKLKVFQAKTSKLFQVAKESIEQEKQKLAADKDQKIQGKIKSNNSEIQKDIENLQSQIERQKQRIGLTAQYKSLLDFVNNRLEDNSYQKLLGLMHQIQDDLADLSDHLTYKPGKTNPEKLKILKTHFPRGIARIVLYIDDLDRCPPDKVVQVLEAVQLLLNTNIFIIVLAIDDRYIGRALEQVYRGVLKRGGTPSGVDYLEKIIQIPYRMRPISKKGTEKYLKSLVDIEEESKKEIPVNVGEQIEEVDPALTNPRTQSISEPRIKELNSEENNRKIQHSANTDPLVSFERFTTEEFSWISECCQHVDLTPRTAKRLINICKIIKTIWTPAPHDTTWKQEPKKEYKQTLIAFLALAGRYPKEMRKVLEEIYLEFEETDENTVTINKDKWLNRLQNLDVFMDRHHQREWKKFKNDFHKMPPQAEFVFEKRTFNLAVSFCFVGDIGYDPDDNYNREYRFEDRQKQYGFKSI
ncbi:P-loop NTPase fold protein [Aphanizomenon sp. CS-733/32]|uniref:P-loop NTPase fold protein n=1 Tax=Aphanizomenon sp. CS-733/32 TaxID=3021715 RepID=UPI0023303756|nr:P-loop NTPase fold protein [Aphanizomenon sp. CS-733/32]MDB9308420.1 P-loop NTPase fold protein [Aphanizomenon sp. CS-733/32]